MAKFNVLKFKENFIKILRQQSILFILIFVFIILSIFAPSFITINNLINIVKQVTVIGIIACGFTLVLINADLDLSVGSLFSLTGVIAITFQQKSIILSIIMPILIAAFVGFINGYITTKFNLSSIIVTLGMLSIIGGIALIYTNGYNVLGDDKSPYSLIANGEIFKIPAHILIFIFIAVILLIILRLTIFGRDVYLIGTNPEAARIAGVNVNKVRILSFIICAVCVAIASIVQSARISSASPVAGSGFEFDVITVVLVGGTSFFGGRGSIYNTIVGTLLIAVLINGMILFNFPFAFQSIIKGFLIFIAMLVDIKARTRLEGK